MLLLINLLFLLVQFCWQYSSAFISLQRHHPDKIALSSNIMSSSQYFQPSFLLTSATVEQALASAEKCAVSNGFQVTIAICDAGGIPLLVKRLDGAFPASVKIAMGKAETAAQFCKSTAGLEAAANVTDGKSRSALLTSKYVLMRGGVPLFVNGVCCGGIGVSGVKPDEDELVATAAAECISALATSKL